MKHISKLFIGAALLVSAAGCKKEENKIYYEGGTNPVLSAAQTSTIPLSYANRDNQGLKLMWTNPNYQFTTGVSSQNVNYKIEIDTTGSNFTNPKRKVITVANDLSVSYTQGEFNGFLLNDLQLDTLNNHNIEIRVTSYLSTNAAILYSNVLKFTTVKPYAIPPVVPPPASGNLYITGAATPAGWQCGCGEPELLSQKFTKLSPTLFVLPSITLSGGNSYLLLPVYGSWSAKYGAIGANNSNNPDGDDFRANGGDLKAPAASGNYKIEVDFQRGKFTVTKL